MAFSMQLGSAHHLNPCSNIVKEFVSSSALLPPRYCCSSKLPATMPAICTLATPFLFDLFGSNIGSAPQLWRLKSHYPCEHHVLAGPRYLSLATRRSPKRRLIVCSTAASIASTSSEAISDDQFVTLLGRQFLRRDVHIAYTATATVLLSIGNRIMYKMALIPLKRHPLFLAQLNTVAFVAVYSAILFMRYRAGIVTQEMLAFPKSKFVLIGALEALAIAMGMASAAVLPGASLPILTQVFMVWQLILSATILKERYTVGQIAGCLLVIAGVIVVVASGSGGAVGTVASLQQQQQSGSSYFWPLVMIFSTLFQAGASILKEEVFQDAARQLKGGSLDIFVMNTLGSIFQTLFVFLMLPLVFNVRGVPLHEIPRNFLEGYTCFVNAGAGVSGCQGAPLVPLLYVAVNMAFNICSLSLLKQSSAIVSSLCVTLSIPLSIWAFTVPWPYLGAPPTLPPGLFLGAAILIAGLALYSASGARKNNDAMA